MLLGMFFLVFIGAVFLLLSTGELLAASDFIDPNGDGGQSGLEKFNCFNFFECVDDGTRQPSLPITNDYINLNLDDYGFFTMNSIAGVNQVSQVDVWVYHEESKNNTGLQVEIWNETETVRYGEPIDLPIQRWGGWNVASFSGLSLTSSQLDGIKVQLIGNRRQPGAAGNVSVFTLYIEVTYNPSAPQYSLEQVSYRWRNDNGGETAILESAGFINPSGDFNASWNIAVPGPSHFEAINEGAVPLVDDYIEANNRSADEFVMDTLIGDGPYQRIDVYIYGAVTDNDRLGVSLVIKGVPQTEQMITFGSGFSWKIASFSGFSLSPDDLDSLRVRIRHVKISSYDMVRVADLRAEVFRLAVGASFKAAENIPINGQLKNENVRLRFLIKNNGPQEMGSQNYRLEWANVVGIDCAGGEEVFSGVMNQANCAGSPVCLTGTNYFIDQSPSVNISQGLTDPAGSFRAGKLVEDPSNEAILISLDSVEFTELEYNLQFTNNAESGQSYCLRVVANEAPLQSYLEIAKITLSGGYVVAGSYFSSAFNAGRPSVFNIIEWRWSKTNPDCVACNIKMQIQTAPDAGGAPGIWSTTWAGPDGEDGDETDFFTSSSGSLIHTDHNGDQWIRYKATLEGEGRDSPILEKVIINYK